MLLTSTFVSQKMGAVKDKPNQDLDFLKKLIESGKVKPVIEKTFPLNETAEAMCHMEKGHARGKVIIIVPKGLLSCSI